MRTIYYYSFMVGLPTDKEENFKFHDLKVPAYNPISAMFQRQIIFAFNQRINKYDYEKDKLYSIYRQVYEYELTSKRGKTTFVFTLVKIYNMSDTLFKQYK